MFAYLWGDLNLESTEFSNYKFLWVLANSFIDPYQFQVDHSSSVGLQTSKYVNELSLIFCERSSQLRN